MVHRKEKQMEKKTLVYEKKLLFKDVSTAA